MANVANDLKEVQRMTRSIMDVALLLPNSDLKDIFLERIGRLKNYIIMRRRYDREQEKKKISAPQNIKKLLAK